MARINSYLTFSGNCREAMTFYKDCLGGELFFQPIADSPMADKIPEQLKGRILHSALTKGDLLLMASDMVPEDGLTDGNKISLMLDCSSDEEIESYYEKLSSGGSADHPLEDTFWGARFGDLTDKFGNHWLLNYSRKQ